AKTCEPVAGAGSGSGCSAARRGVRGTLDASTWLLALGVATALRRRRTSWAARRRVRATSAAANASSQEPAAARAEARARAHPPLDPAGLDSHAFVLARHA